MIPGLLFAVLLGTDLTGVWTGAPSPSISLTLTLQQTGDSVSGTEQIAGRVFRIENGHIENDKLTFTFPIPAGGRLRHIPTVVTLQNDELHLRDTGPEIVLRRVSPDPEDARMERLASVIRVWGAIRFFHPYVASRSIDWDAALIAAIQPVDKAERTEDFVAVISKMLSALDDPETRVLAPDEPEPPPIACQCRAIIRSGFFEGAPSASAPYYVDWESVGKRASYIMRLPNGVRVAIRTAEPDAGGTGIGTNDEPHIGDLPSRELRLLALAPYRRVEFLTPSEIQELIRTIPTHTFTGLRLRVLVEVLLSTGLRISEALSLNHNSIDRESGEAEIIGKGNRPRIAFFSEECLAWIDRYVAFRSDGCHALFITTGRTPTRLGRADMSKAFKRLRRLSGISKRLTPHLLRHTFCTSPLHNGADITFIKELAGHQDIQTTARYYLGVDRASLRSVLRRSQIHGWVTPMAETPQPGLSDRPDFRKPDNAHGQPSPPGDPAPDSSDRLPQAARVSGSP